MLVSKGRGAKKIYLCFSFKRFLGLALIQIAFCISAQTRNRTKKLPNKEDLSSEKPNVYFLMEVKARECLFHA